MQWLINQSSRLAKYLPNSIKQKVKESLVKSWKPWLDDILIAPQELKVINSYSMCGIHVLSKLFKLGRYVVEHNIPGEFVECGVCNGGSAAAIALGLGCSGKEIWLFDSFRGLPETREEEDGLFASNYIGKCVGSEENVKAALNIAGCNDHDYIIRKGLFENTFKEPLPEKIALLHIDADWYDSVKLSLDTFYELVEDGGVIVLDDFGCWEGCRQAFYDFAEERKIKPLLERFGYSQAFWIKGKMHNRNLREKKELF